MVEGVTDLVSLRLEPLEDLFETVQAGLTHSIQRVAAFDLAKVWRSAAPGGDENVGLAGHVLDHEVLPLEMGGFLRKSLYSSRHPKKDISEVGKRFTGKSNSDGITAALM